MPQLTVNIVVIFGKTFRLKINLTNHLRVQKGEATQRPPRDPIEKSNQKNKDNA